MSFVEKQLTYLFSSSTLNGAINKSRDGDIFSVQLDAPIAITHNAAYATLEVVQANIVWVMPNISAEIGNNNFYYHTEYIPTDRPLPPQWPNFSFVLDDGLYSLDTLGQALSRQFASNGLPQNLITLSADTATQKVVLTFNSDAPTWADFTQLNNPREILGFNSRLVPLIPQLSGYSEIADGPAKFNSITSFLINTDLISDGIPVNNTSGGTIASIQISVAPGSLITYQPNISLKTNCSELIGNSKNFFTFRLTDQDRRSVDTAGEDWSVTVVIKYYIKM